jgi:hypothetical protein
MQLEAMMDNEARKAAETVLKMVNAVIETVVEAGPNGTPRGPLFLAFQSHGVSLSQYNYLEELALSSGKIRRHGDLLITVE